MDCGEQGLSHNEVSAKWHIVCSWSDSQRNKYLLYYFLQDLRIHLEFRNTVDEVIVYDDKCRSEKKDKNPEAKFVIHVVAKFSRIRTKSVMSVLKGAVFHCMVNLQLF